MEAEAYASPGNTPGGAGAKKGGAMDEEIRSHYHMVYEKKIPRGVIKIDINALAPRSEIAKAFEDINDWFNKDCQVQDDET